LVLSLIILVLAMFYFGRGTLKSIEEIGIKVQEDKELTKEDKKPTKPEQKTKSKRSKK